MVAVSASPRLKRIQRGSVALLVLGCAVNYMDRSTLAIANPLIRHDLGLSIADMGLLLSAFLWAYAAFQLPAGATVSLLPTNDETGKMFANLGNQALAAMTPMLLLDYAGKRISFYGDCAPRF